MATTRPARVLVVDDSAVVREALRAELLTREGIGAVETAADGATALRKVGRFDPDVVTMDVEMPGLDGLATLRRLMAQAPRPVIMLSAHTTAGAARTIRALEMGAVDFIEKPTAQNGHDLRLVVSDLCSKIGVLCGRWRGRRPRAGPRPEEPSPRSGLPAGGAARAVVAIGASTGGTEAIREVLEGLPRDLAAGVLVVQHMPAGFTLAFANRLDQLCALEVKEARHRDLVRPGRVLVAPGDHHLLVRREGNTPFVELGCGPRVKGHRPSVDVTMQAAADVFGSRTVGVLLTGMGKDGASGMQRIQEKGGRTIAQDEDSSVVFGMPKAAIDLGVVDEVQSLASIRHSVCRAVKGLEDEGRAPGAPALERPRLAEGTQAVERR